MLNKSILLLTYFRFENLSKQGVLNCSLFAIYDGHGGNDCCNFLKENLHTYILSQYQESDFPKSIQNACDKADLEFMNRAQKDYYCNTSGSCALSLIVMGTHLTLI